MSRGLVLVGAGGFARETAAAVHAINDARPTWALHGFLDDDPALPGTHRAGVSDDLVRSVLQTLDRTGRGPQPIDGYGVQLL